jgi:hypothetical protein
MALQRSDFPIALRFDKLGDKDVQSVAGGPQGQADGSGRFPLPVSGVNLNITIHHPKLPGLCAAGCNPPWLPYHRFSTDSSALRPPPPRPARHVAAEKESIPKNQLKKFRISISKRLCSRTPLGIHGGQPPTWSAVADIRALPWKAVYPSTM